MYLVYYEYFVNNALYGSVVLNYFYMLILNFV